MLHVACLHGLTGGVFFSEFGKWQNVNISILNEQKRTQWQTPIISQLKCKMHAFLPWKVRCRQDGTVRAPPTPTVHVPEPIRM